MGVSGATAAETDVSNAHWDGLDGQGQALASGAYLCRLIARGQVMVRRIALVGQRVQAGWGARANRGLIRMAGPARRDLVAPPQLLRCVRCWAPFRVYSRTPEVFGGSDGVR